MVGLVGRGCGFDKSVNYLLLVQTVITQDPMY